VAAISWRALVSLWYEAGERTSASFDGWGLDCPPETLLPLHGINIILMVKPHVIFFAQAEFMGQLGQFGFVGRQ